MQIVRVPVSDTTVDAVQHNGAIWVPVRRVCETLGLNPDGQRVKLAEKPWACTEMIYVHDLSGRPQATFCVRLDSLPMWLATIDHARVDSSVVHRLIAFQREAHEALARHFGVSGGAPRTGGGAGSGGGATSGANMSGAAELLAMVKGLTGALEATLAETAAVRADAAAARAVAEQALDGIDETKHLADTARVVAGNASALADDAQTVARLALDEARRAGSKGIPVARRRAAVGHITRAVRTFCATHGIGYQKVYAELRRDLGLPRKQDGGPALGTADLRADQIIRLARCANNMGVPDCGAHVIEAILSGGVQPPPTITMTPSAPARTADVVDTMLDFVTAKPTGPVQ